MAGHQHIWEKITFSDGAQAEVCLCGIFHVRFTPELPRRQDVHDPKILDDLEEEGTADVT